MKGGTQSAIVLGLVLLGVALFFFLHRSPEQKALVSRELATRGLAEHLAGRFSDRRVLVISNPFVRDADLPGPIRAQEEAGLRGLRRGFGEHTALAVAYPELQPAGRNNPRAAEMDPDATTPMSYLVTNDAFDKLAKENPECETIVSLIGVPANLETVEIWQKPGAPRFGLLLPDLRLIGDRAVIIQAMKLGKLAAFVMNKPGAPAEQAPVQSDHRVEFERRFVLVTPENIEQIVQTYPQLF